MLKNSFYTILIIVLLQLAQNSIGQTSPVTVTTLMGYPSSLYLPDYYKMGSNKLKANIILNDFNEPSRDVYLNIRLESSDVKIYTKPDYNTVSPITLYPGELRALTGDELEEYLTYNNIVLEGISQNEMISGGGRLPEGFYQFCIEVYDYETRRLLSNTSCAVAHLAQHDPPKLISPKQGEMVAPSSAQNIVFSWLNNAPIDLTNLTYKVTLYELTDPQADPKQAVQNNKVLVVHEEETTAPVFNYNSAHPMLETGKTYIITVQALTFDGRVLFKNNGVSEPVSFHYGYPSGGKIQLLSPEDGGALKLTREKVFSWTAPDNLLAGQSYNYEIRIAKADSNRKPEDILAEEGILYSEKTADRSGNINYFQNIVAHFATGENFNWQVTAFTEEQEIAKSEISTFGGPPCILDFIGANEYITVTYTDGCDLSNISGKGTVKLNDKEETLDVWFNNVKIERDGVQYYLREGEVLGVFEDFEPMKLSPDFERNGNAYFHPDTLRITRYDYELKGQVKWNFPHAADQEETPVVVSEPTWVNYSGYELAGKVPLPDSLGFDMLDPLNFRIEFTKGSRFYLLSGFKYLLEFQGHIVLPENVKTPEGNETIIHFKRHNQLFNIRSDDETVYPAIRVNDKTTLNLTPERFIFDFDNQASPGKFSSDQLWRGLFIQSANYSFNGDYAFSKQFACNKPLKTNYEFEGQDHAYVLANGLNLHSNIKFPENELFFNTFPAFLNNFYINVEASQTLEGNIKGEMTIPLLSDTEHFSFTSNLTRYGFQAGYLDEDIEEKTFIFNEGSDEQELYITFNRGYFADNERIESNITIYWPYTDLTFENLPQFRIWGNYDIGFGAPNNGLTLARQRITRIKGFDITFDAVAAGRQANLYSIGFTGNMQMGEDVSGTDGPPLVNLYSIYENKAIDEEYAITGISEYENVDQSTKGTGSTGSSTVGLKTDEIATIGDLEALKASYAAKQAKAAAEIQAAKPKWPVGEQQSDFNLEQELTVLAGNTNQYIEKVGEQGLNQMSIKELTQLLAFIAPFLEAEEAAQVNDLVIFLEELNNGELQHFIEKFTDIRGLLSELIEGYILNEIQKQTQPIRELANKINRKIATPIENGTKKLTDEFGKLIDQVMNAIVEAALSVLNPKQGTTDRINEMSVSVRNHLKAELERTVNVSVQKNIIDYLTSTVDFVLYDGTINWLSKELAKNASEVIINPDFKLADVNIDVQERMDSVGNYLAAKFTFNKMKGQIERTFQETFDGFNWDSIQNVFIQEFAVGILAEKAQELIGGAVGEFAAGAIDGLAQNVELDFNNLGNKLKKGDVGGVVKFDPSKIEIRSQPVDIDGFVNFINDDPIWGDCWRAEINAKVKIPDEESAFIVLVDYVNGNKPKSNKQPEPGETVETFKYWFIEVGVMDINIPLGPLPVAIYGMKGRIYHHMCRLKDNITYQPNDSVRYGAGLKVYMFHAATEGTMLDMNLGVELELVSGGFIFEMNGEAFIINVPEEDGGGENSKAIGDGSHVYSNTLVYSRGYIKYNSVDRHLLGEVSAYLQAKPIICAGGGMIIDVSKDWWRIAIGTRKEPLGISLFCKDTIFRGWFDINQNGLDVGLMINLALDLRSPYVNLGFAKVQGWAKISFDFEAELIAFWRPNFGIQKARGYIDLYAGAGINYKTPPLFNKKHTFTIAALNIGGEMEFATIPQTYFRGELRGSVTVLNCKAGIKLKADITL